MMSPKARKNDEGGYYWIESKQLWRRVWDIDPWPDGRRRQQSVSGRTQKIVNEKYAKIMAAKASGLNNADMTIAEWAAEWLEDVQKPTMTPNGLRNYESINRKWITPAIGSKRVSELTTRDVTAVMKRARDAGKSTGTMRKVYNVLSQMMAAAKRADMVSKNVVENIKPPKVQAKERGALTTEQALSVLNVASRYIDGSKWWATLLAGVRQGERLGARIDSLDLDAGTLKVEWSLTEVTSEHGCQKREDGSWACGKKRGGSCPQRRLKLPDGFDHIPLGGRLVLKRPKSGKARTVPLIPPLVEALRRYLDETAHVPNPHGLIWRHNDGTPFLPGEDEQAWRDLLFEAGVITQEQTKEPRRRAVGTPDIPTTHWGRHTTATVMLELGVDVKVVGEIVGHVDAKTTRGYQHVSSALARDGMNRVGAHFSKALDSPSSGG